MKLSLAVLSFAAAATAFTAVGPARSTGLSTRVAVNNVFTPAPVARAST